MPLTPLIRAITGLPAYKDLLEDLPTEGAPLDLGLARAARLPMVAAIRESAQRPILLITDRADQAFTVADELSLWAPKAPRLIFPEPNPLFYEEASWGRTVRRERLVARNALAYGGDVGPVEIQIHSHEDRRPSAGGQSLGGS